MSIGIAYNPCKNCQEMDKCSICELTYYIKGYIKSPAANVVEVRHGEWKTTPDYKPDTLTAYHHICSECKTIYKDVRPYGHKYCHECGAKMDVERSEG